MSLRGFRLARRVSEQAASRETVRAIERVNSFNIAAWHGR
jgi:hypothetical protein